MQPDGNPRTGLWKKESKYDEGSSYYSGKLTVEGVEYWANLYQNDKQDDPRAPQLNLVLKPVENKPPAIPGPGASNDIPF